MKNKAVLWVVIGCLAIAGGVATFAVWKLVWKRSKPAPAVVGGQARPGLGPPMGGATNALFEAAKVGDLATLKEMLDTHPELMNQPVRHYGGATPLNMAAYRGNTEAVAELLRRKANVNARTREGHTPLYDCILLRGTPEIALMLLEHGADPTLPDYLGKTPLQLAIDRNRDDMAALLRQHGVQR